jgi:hypothetical protein
VRTPCGFEGFSFGLGSYSVGAAGIVGQKGAGKGELDIGVRDLVMDGSRITVAGSGHGLEGVTRVQGGGEGRLEAGTAGAAWVGGRFSETQSLMAAKELEVAMHTHSNTHTHTRTHTHTHTHCLSLTQTHTNTVVSMRICFMESNMCRSY